MGGAPRPLKKPGLRVGVILFLLAQLFAAANQTLRLRAAGGRGGGPSLIFAPLPAPGSEHSKYTSTLALGDAMVSGQ